ncbi:MAG: TRZ/ATZ family hydrolase [Neisseriaceae bacterium]
MAKTKLIQPSWLITMDDRSPILREHAVLVEGDRVKAILSSTDAKKLKIDKKIELKNHVLMPGLINLHGHSAMALFRGYADDLNLMRWLKDYIWPLEKQWMSPKFVYEGSLLAMAEMILSGTTTVNDMYFYPKEVAKAALAMHMRTFVGCTILEFPTNYARTANEYLQKALKEESEFQGEALIKFTLAPHAPYTVSDESFRKIVRVSHKKGMLLHSHIHETQEEVEQSMKEFGKRPLERLEKLGVLDENLIAAHMVVLTQKEIERAAKLGLSVAHNPASNLKLASGFSPVQSMLEAGVLVGLGTDSAASNNRLDLFAELRLASLLAKGVALDSTALNAYESLKLATCNGAKALHMQDQIGSIKPGTYADLIAVRLDKLENQPLYDPLSHLVYTLGRENVTDVWINGKRVLKNRIFTSPVARSLPQIANRWRRRLIAQKEKIHGNSN